MTAAPGPAPGGIVAGPLPTATNPEVHGVTSRPGTTDWCRAETIRPPNDSAPLRREADVLSREVALQEHHNDLVV